MGGVNPNAWQSYVAPLTEAQQNAYNQSFNLFGMAQPDLDAASNAAQGAMDFTRTQSPGMVQEGSNALAIGQERAGNYVGAFDPLRAGVQYANQIVPQASPFLNQGAGYVNQGAGDVSRLSQGDIEQYLSPFQSNVIDATMANLGEVNSREQQGVLGNAIASGAFGGDRSAVAQGELSRQHGLAAGQTLAGLHQQNYAQALQTGLQQQNVEAQNRGRELQAGAQMADIGTRRGALEAQAAGLSGDLGSRLGNLTQQQVGSYADIGTRYGNMGAQAAEIGNAQVNQANTLGNIGMNRQRALLNQMAGQEASGSLARSVNQDVRNAAYEQYLRRMSYPYQALQYRAGVQLPAGGAMGGMQQQLGDMNWANQSWGNSQGQSASQQQSNPLSTIGGLFSLGKGMMAGGGRVPLARGGRIDTPFSGNDTSPFSGSIIPAVSNLASPNINFGQIPHLSKHSPPSSDGSRGGPGSGGGGRGSGSGSRGSSQQRQQRARTNPAQSRTGATPDFTESPTRTGADSRPLGTSGATGNHPGGDPTLAARLPESMPLNQAMMRTSPGEAMGFPSPTAMDPEAGLFGVPSSGNMFTPGGDFDEFSGQDEFNQFGDAGENYNYDDALSMDPMFMDEGFMGGGGGFDEAGFGGLGDAFDFGGFGKGFRSGGGVKRPIHMEAGGGAGAGAGAGAGWGTGADAFAQDITLPTIDVVTNRGEPPPPPPSDGGGGDGGHGYGPGSGSAAGAGYAGGLGATGFPGFSPFGDFSTAPNSPITFVPSVWNNWSAITSPAPYDARGWADLGINAPRGAVAAARGEFSPQISTPTWGTFESPQMSINHAFNTPNMNMPAVNTVQTVSFDRGTPDPNPNPNPFSDDPDLNFWTNPVPMPTSDPRGRGDEPPPPTEISVTTPQVTNPRSDEAVRADWGDRGPVIGFAEPNAGFEAPTEGDSMGAGATPQHFLFNVWSNLQNTPLAFNQMLNAGVDTADVMRDVMSPWTGLGIPAGTPADEANRMFQGHMGMTPMHHLAATLMRYGVDPTQDFSAAPGPSQPFFNLNTFGLGSPITSVPDQNQQSQPSQSNRMIDMRGDVNAIPRPSGGEPFDGVREIPPSHIPQDGLVPQPLFERPPGSFERPPRGTPFPGQQHASDIFGGNFRPPMGGGEPFNGVQPISPNMIPPQPNKMPGGFAEGGEVEDEEEYEDGFVDQPMDPMGPNPSDPGQEIYGGLRWRGVPDVQAAGLAGNIFGESGYNSGLNERNPSVPGSRGGFGLHQATGSRRKAMEEFLAQRGLAPNDQEGQLDFIAHELGGPENAAYKNTMLARSPAEAARIFERDFQRPGIPSTGRRMAEANRLYSGNGRPPVQADHSQVPPGQSRNPDDMEENQPPPSARPLSFDRPQRSQSDEARKRYWRTLGASMLANSNMPFGMALGEALQSAQKGEDTVTQAAEKLYGQATSKDRDLKEERAEQAWERLQLQKQRMEEARRLQQQRLQQGDTRIDLQRQRQNRPSSTQPKIFKRMNPETGEEEVYHITPEGPKKFEFPGTQQPNQQTPQGAPQRREPSLFQNQPFTTVPTRPAGQPPAQPPAPQAAPPKSVPAEQNQDPVMAPQPVERDAFINQYPADMREELKQIEADPARAQKASMARQGLIKVAALDEGLEGLARKEFAQVQQQIAQGGDAPVPEKTLDKADYDEAYVAKLPPGIRREVENVLNGMPIKDVDKRIRSRVFSDARTANPDFGKMKTSLSPQAIEQAARRAMEGDPAATSGFGHGTVGATNRAAVLNRMYQIAEEEGISPKDLALRAKDLQGYGQEQRTMGTQAARIVVAKSEAEKLIDPLLLANQNRVGTQYRDLNSLVNAAQRRTGDENVVKYGLALNTFIEAYSRAISPTGVPTETQRKHAREKFDEAFSKGQMSQVLAQAKVEMEVAEYAVYVAINKSRGRRLDSMKGKTPEEPNLTTPPPKSGGILGAPAAPSVPKGLEGKQLQINKDGTKFRDKETGTVYDKDGKEVK